MPMAPGQPLFLIWAGVNRLTNDGHVRGPEQRVSPLGALRAVTLDAAYSLQLDQQVGSIVPGKRANFTILAANPLRSDPVRIKDIPIWGTVQEGRMLPVRRSAGTGAAAGPGPILDRATWEAVQHAETSAASHGHGHRGGHGNGDSCTLAQHLAEAAAAAVEAAIPATP